MSFSPRIVIPGDIVHEISDSPDSGGPKESSGIVLGPGLIRAEGASVRVAKPGVLRAKQDQRKAAEGGTAFYWVDSHSR